MENEIKECRNKLEKLSDNFLLDKCTEVEQNIVNLLQEIIVVEKETIGVDRLFDQLKENYFESDEATANFINSLYKYEVDAISQYLDIYIEEAYENEMNENDINEKIYRITDLMRNIKPELVILLEEKLTNIRNNG